MRTSHDLFRPSDRATRRLLFLDLLRANVLVSLKRIVGWRPWSTRVRPAFFSAPTFQKPQSQRAFPLSPPEV